MFEFAFEVGNLLVDLRGVIRVIPEFGLIHFLGQLIQLFADMVNVEGIARGKQDLRISASSLRYWGISMSAMFNLLQSSGKAFFWLMILLLGWIDA